MRAIRSLLSIGASIAAVSCLDTPFTPSSDAQIRVVNGSASQVSIGMDGTQQFVGVKPGSVSAFFVRPGVHHFNFSLIGGTGPTLDLSGASQGVTTAVLYDSPTGSLAAFALDTGSAVPVGKSKVRVALLTKTFGDVDVWRVQPDFRTPTKIQTPFPYLTTSPFVQSDSGYWEVFVTPVGSTTRLRSTGQFYVQSTGRRTVVLMDSGGVPFFRVMPE